MPRLTGARVEARRFGLLQVAKTTQESPVPAVILQDDFDTRLDANDGSMSRIERAINAAKSRLDSSSPTSPFF